MAQQDLIEQLVNRLMVPLIMLFVIWMLMQKIGIDEGIRAAIRSFVMKRSNKEEKRDFWAKLIRKRIKYGQKLNYDRTAPIFIIPNKIKSGRRIGKYRGGYARDDVHFIIIKMKGLIRNKAIIAILPELVSGYKGGNINLYIRDLEPEGPFLFPVLDDNWKDRIGNKFNEKEDVINHIRTVIDTIATHEETYLVKEEEVVAATHAMGVGRPSVNLFDTDPGGSEE